MKVILCSITERKEHGLGEADLIVSTESLGDTLSIEQCDSVLNELNAESHPCEVIWLFSRLNN